MLKYIHTILLLLTLMLIMYLPLNGFLHADTHHEVGDTSTFLVYHENDYFGKTDKHYTSASKLTWISKDLKQNGNGLPDWSGWIAGKMPGIKQNGSLHNLSFSLGQNIYTPENTLVERLVEDDRPYAGWTYLSLGLHSKDTNNFTQSFGITLFAGVDGRAIAQNIFLDGNTFKKSHSVNKENFVADLYGGISVFFHRYKITYTHVYRTEEFEEQDTGQYYGSCSLALIF